MPKMGRALPRQLYWLPGFSDWFQFSLLCFHAAKQQKEGTMPGAFDVVHRIFFLSVFLLPSVSK